MKCRPKEMKRRLDLLKLKDWWTCFRENLEPSNPRHCLRRTVTPNCSWLQ